MRRFGIFELRIAKEFERNREMIINRLKKWLIVCAAAVMANEACAQEYSVHQVWDGAIIWTISVNRSSREAEIIGVSIDLERRDSDWRYSSVVDTGWTIEIPTSLNGYLVTSIGRYAFDSSSYSDYYEDVLHARNIRYLTIPGTVKIINDRAFYCEGGWMQYVVLSEGVECIGDQAFYG